MRDIAFVAFLATLLLLAIRRPFLFVLAYAYIDIVAPQRLSYYLLNSVPVSLLVAGLAVLLALWALGGAGRDYAARLKAEGYPAGFAMSQALNRAQVDLAPRKEKQP